MIPEKRCNACGATKPRESFSRRGATGLQPRCKECQKQYYRNNKARIAAQQAEYHQAHKAEKREYDQQRWGGPKRAVLLDQHRNYWAVNKDGLNRNRREARAAKVSAGWRAELTPEQRAYRTEQECVRRARKLSLPNLPYTRAEIYARDEGRCCHCGEHVDKQEFWIEHHVPLRATAGMLNGRAHPGDVPWNVGVSHPSCNMSKGNRRADWHLVDEIASHLNAASGS